MRKKLPRSFFADRNIFRDFAAIAFEMDTINQQQLMRLRFVGSESKTAGRSSGAGRFPFLNPGA